MKNTIGKKVAIIGGGPSGLMAAEVIATAGHHVTIYDRMPSLGRKFLMAGRGGLNITHTEALDSFVQRYGEAAGWLTPYIQSFPPDALRAWCEELGQELYVGSSGRVFPRCMKAAPLLRSWLQRLGKLGVEFAAQHRWEGWENGSLKFSHAQETIFVKPDATLLALGGASWPRLGSDGSWIDILSEYGVDISPLRPANCGFLTPWSMHFSNRFAGVPIKPVMLSHNGISQQGEVMVTADGLEGGAVYALSAQLRESIIAHGSTTIHLDLRPTMSFDALRQKLEGRRGSKSLSNYLRKAGFSPIAIGLLREVTPSEKLVNVTPAMLAAWFKALPIKLIGIKGLERAISTAGGIKQSALDDHFMLHAKPGTFATGEMLDWEAPTGGYLLQACFALGFTAGRGIVAYCED